MDGKKPLQYYKSPSRASRVVCETLNSEKLVWLAPVSSPLLSPGREKMKVARKKVKQGSIFALPRRAKVSIEAEEPISPKVSCIGHVRTSKKTSFSDNRAGESQHYKPSSASPARFFSSPRGRSKWGSRSKWSSLFRSSKDAHRAAPSSCGGEVSCFGSPRNSSSGYNPERSCSAFFAKSLLLLQECEERAECSKSEVAQMHSHAHAPHSQTHAHAHNGGAVAKQIKSIVPIPSRQFAFEQGDTHTLRVADTLSEPMIIQQRESCAHETVTNKHVHEIPSLKLNCPPDVCDAVKHASIEHQQESISEVREAEEKFCLVLPFEENQQGFTQDPTCEELHCICRNKQDLKVSVETAPETWLCRNGKHNGVSLLSGVCDEGSSRDHLRKVQGEEGLTSSSCDEECLSYGDEALTLSSCNEECSLHDATDCHRHEVSSCQTATHSSTSNVTMLEDDITCRAVEGEDASRLEKMCALNEEENANVEILDRADEHGHGLRHHEEHAGELEASDHVLSSSYTHDTHSWENYRMPRPQLCEKDLHCFLRKGTPCVWGVRGASSGDAFLLLEYNLSKSFACFKDDRDKVVISEVGKVSFHGARRQLHWLEGENKLIRSRSATSYRTVIRFQRCKSEPGKSY